MHMTFVIKTREVKNKEEKKDHYHFFLELSFELQYIVFSILSFH